MKNEYALSKMNEKINKVNNSKNEKELVLVLFPLENDDVSASKIKREMWLKWIDLYKNDNLGSQRLKTPTQLVNDFYPKHWDKEDDWFQKLRNTIINRIVNFKK